MTPVGLPFLALGSMEGPSAWPANGSAMGQGLEPEQIARPLPRRQDAHQPRSHSSPTRSRSGCATPACEAARVAGSQGARTLASQELCLARDYDQSTARLSGRSRSAGALGGRPHPWSWQLEDRHAIERTTRFTMLLHLRRLAGHGEAPRMKNRLAGYGAEAVRDAITRTITTLPEEFASFADLGSGSRNGSA